MKRSRGVRLVWCINALLWLLFAGGADAARAQNAVEFVNPANGAAVSGTVSISLSASAQVSRIHVFIDGRQVPTHNARQFTWHAGKARKGVHRIAARAYGSNGAYLGSATINVRVMGHASVAISSPASGSTVQGTVGVVTAVTGNVTWINLYIDNNYWISSPPFSFSWNSTTVPNGKHTIAAKAYESGGALVAQSSISVNVQNPVTATPTPTKTPSPTPSAVPTPTATPTRAGAGPQTFESSTCANGGGVLGCAADADNAHCAVSVPSTTQDNDLIVLWAATTNKGNCATPAGFAPIGKITSGFNFIFGYYKVASTETGSYTLSCGGSSFPTCVAEDWRGVSTANPIDTSGKNFGASSSVMTFAGITTTVNNDLLLAIGQWGANNSSSCPSGFTSSTILSTASNSTFGTSDCYEAQPTHGPIAQFNQSISGGTNTGFATLTVALEPAPAATPTATATPTVAPTATATPTIAPTATPTIVRTPSPTPTVAPTVTPTATATTSSTPSATPTPAGIAYYVDALNGSDANNGTSAATAWKSLAKVQSVVGSGAVKAGTAFLFASGETWSGGLELSGLNGSTASPIVFGSYNSGAPPILDGGGMAQYGFHATSGSHVTINGFEIRNFVYNGVSLHSSGGAMPGWTIENCAIHNTGPGAYSGGSGAFDDGHYRNQLELLDYGYHADGVRFIHNSVYSCGGHNCIQVHGDTGGPLIQQNTCYGWLHNCIDVKAVVGALVYDNLVHGPASNGSAFYTENTQIPAADVTWMQNVVYDAPNGLECEGGGGTSSQSVTCRAYNNTLYLGNSSAIVTGDGCTQPISWDVRNNILDTSDATYIPSTCSNRIITWDYNDDCGSMGTCSSLYIGLHDLDGVNPDYVNAAANPPNLQLQAGSRLINAGAAGLTPNDNDIGAY